MSEPPPGVRPDLFIWLDSEMEAASGTAKPVTLPTPAGEPPQTVTVNVPPGVRPGTLLRLPGVGRINPLTGQPNDLFARVMIRKTNKVTRQVLAGTGAFVVFGLIIWLLVASLSGSPTTNTASTESSSALPLPTFSNIPSAGSDQPTVGSSSLEPSIAPVPPPAPTSQVFDTGTCLSGTLPNSTVATPVGSDVTEVSCSSPDAHYRVIQNIPNTNDLNRCESNPQTQYAFSSEEDVNGIPTDEYVYCLVGIGSYSK